MVALPAVLVFFFIILMLPSTKLKLKLNGIHPDVFKDTRKIQGTHKPNTSYLF